MPCEVTGLWFLRSWLKRVGGIRLPHPSRTPGFPFLVLVLATIAPLSPTATCASIPISTTFAGCCVQIRSVMCVTPPQLRSVECCLGHPRKTLFTLSPVRFPAILTLRGAHSIMPSQQSLQDTQFQPLCVSLHLSPSFSHPTPSPLQWPHCHLCRWVTLSRKSLFLP